MSERHKMSEFEKYKLGCCKTCATDVYIDMCEVCPAMRPRRIGWKAALRMIKSEGVISDYELASKIIKDELKEG